MLSIVVPEDMGIDRELLTCEHPPRIEVGSGGIGRSRNPNLHVGLVTHTIVKIKSVAELVDLRCPVVDVRDIWISRVDRLHGSRQFLPVDEIA